MKVNYHLHTTYSDGARPVPQVLQLLSAAGVQSFALTDHDTVQGVSEAQTLAKQYGMHFVTGAELTVSAGEEEGLPSRCSVHLLGFGFDTQAMARLLQKSFDRREEAIDNLIFLLRKNGYTLFERKLELNCGIGFGVLSKYSVAVELQRCGYVGSLDEGFLLLRQPQYAGVSDARLGVKEGIEMIHTAGGKAFWAHPFEVIARGQKTLLRQNAVQSAAKEFRAMGLDGLEAYYQNFLTEEILFLKRLAETLSLQTSVGTDFHDEDARLPAGKGNPEFNRNIPFFQKPGVVVPRQVYDYFQTLGTF